MKPSEALEHSPEVFLASGLAAFRQGLKDLRAVLQVPEDLDSVEWAERHFRLSAETTGSTEPVRLYGYQKAILRAMSDQNIEILVVPKSTRTGLTQLVMIDAAFEISHRHNQVIVIQPTDLKAQEFSNDYLQPAFRDSEELAAIVRRPKKGERQNTWADIQYSNGGAIRMGWASSDDTFRGRTAGKMYPDEVDADAWEPTAASQGDKLDMLLDRGETRAGSKMVVCSSPTRRRGSRIWPLWEKSDQQRYHVPCPSCGEMQWLKWGGEKVTYGIKPHYDEDGAFQHAFYVCEVNGCIIPDEKEVREKMDAGGEYRATAVAKQRGLVGMHINALYSLAAKSSWTKLWELWVQAQGNPQKLKVFFNTKLGEPWDDVVVDQRVDPGSFAASRPRPFRAEVPRWASWLTAAIDNQKGNQDVDKKNYKPPRHELKVMAWGPGEEGVVIYYEVLPATFIFDADAAKALDAIILDRKWKREDGKEMKILTCAVDCGDEMDQVLTFCQASHRARVYVPVHGASTGDSGVTLAPVVISRPGVHAQTQRKFVALGTRLAKKTLLHRLVNVTEPGPQYIHFPESIAAAMPDGYDYFAGLFAEKSSLDLKGVLKWERVSQTNTGEPWDLLVYNLAALRISMDRYPNVKRTMLSSKLRPVLDDYDGEDRSAMASVLRDKIIGAGTGKTSEVVPMGAAAPAPVYVPKMRAPRSLAVSRSSFGRR